MVNKCCQTSKPRLLFIAFHKLLHHASVLYRHKVNFWCLMNGLDLQTHTHTVNAWKNNTIKPRHLPFFTFPLCVAAVSLWSAHSRASEMPNPRACPERRARCHLIVNWSVGKNKKSTQIFAAQCRNTQVKSCLMSKVTFSLIHKK